MIRRSVPLVLVLLLAFGIVAWSHYTRPKIAFIRSPEMLQSYAGLKASQNAIQEKNQVWQANMDTLEQQYQESVQSYLGVKATLTQAQQQERESTLSYQRGNLEKYAQTLQEKSKEEESRLTEGVLNQVNSLVQEYGKKHGYSLILGTTSEGSLLYAEEGIDITKEMIKRLNDHYKAQSPSLRSEPQPLDTTN